MLRLAQEAIWIVKPPAKYGNFKTRSFDCNHLRFIGDEMSTSVCMFLVVLFVIVMHPIWDIFRRNINLPPAICTERVLRTSSVVFWIYQIIVVQKRRQKAQGPEPVWKG